MQSDFDAFLAEIGLTRQQCEEAKAQVGKVENLDLSIEIKESPIEGLGVFATVPFGTGQTIGIAIEGNKWTALGRYANHARDANMSAKKHGSSVVLLARKQALIGDELTINYRDMKFAMTGGNHE